ncbi:N-acetylmuramoyl-L-alanine amidase [Patescibacteria group bacterium]|nr:N-acetylmuramoyl-L-alanine amidase [Patescibacteria group bacterium]
MKISIHPDNWERGRDNIHKIEGVVIHIMQGSLEGTDQHFKTHVSLSSHSGIGKDGETHTYVEAEDKAYHAGRINLPTWKHIKRNFWGGYINPNSYTYGIECEGYRGDKWVELQIEAIVVDILSIPKELLAFGEWTRDRIISHHEIAADKENMSDWCDEIVKRLNKIDPSDDKVDRVRKLLLEAVKIIDEV